MKAILKDKREAGFTLADIPVPEIGRNEVLIKWRHLLSADQMWMYMNGHLW